MKRTQATRAGLCTACLAALPVALPMAVPLAVPAAPAEPAGKEAPREAVFRLAEDDRWGGQTLIAPRPLYLTRKPAARLSAPLPDGAQVLYGTLAGTAVAQARLKDGSIRVFLDLNGDGELAEAEGVTLRKGVVRWPACADDLSAVVKLGERTAGVWSCRAPNVLFWAWRGVLRGEVSLAGVLRPAFLVDGNGNGKFGETDGDLLWIDRNGDGLLDPVTEQFPWAPVVRIGDERYRFTFEGSGTGGTARYSRVQRSMGRKRVAFLSDLAPRVVGVEGTLLSQADDIIRAERVAQELDLPSGSYALTSLTLRVSPDGKPGGAWSYTFARTLEGKDSKNFPLAVRGLDEELPTDLPVYQRLSFGMDAAETAAPGGEFPVQLWARTELGLELCNTRRAGQGEQDFPEDFATITLLDGGGKVLDEKRTGFA